MHNAAKRSVRKRGERFTGTPTLWGVEWRGQPCEARVGGCDAKQTVLWMHSLWIRGIGEINEASRKIGICSGRPVRVSAHTKINDVLKILGLFLSNPCHH